MFRSYWLAKCLPRLIWLRGRRGGFCMLELRPNCECCGKDLPPDSAEAEICSFECTFCSLCAKDKLHGACPNCGDELVVRPRRSDANLAVHPASTKPVFKPK